MERHGSDPSLGPVPAFGIQMERNPLVPDERIFLVYLEPSDTSKLAGPRRTGVSFSSPNSHTPFKSQRRHSPAPTPTSLPLRRQLSVLSLSSRLLLVFLPHSRPSTSSALPATEGGEAILPRIHSGKGTRNNRPVAGTSER